MQSVAPGEGAGRRHCGCAGRGASTGLQHTALQAVCTATTLSFCKSENATSVSENRYSCRFFRKAKGQNTKFGKGGDTRICQ